MNLSLRPRNLWSAAALLFVLSPLSGGALEPAKTDELRDRPEPSSPDSPAHDYYSRLAKFSGEPSAPILPIDSLRYPAPAPLVRGILAYKPIYLTVSVEAFDMGPPAANSSPRTRAELDYLLRLQEQRTLMEMASNLDFQNWGYVVSAKTTDRDFAELRGNFFRVGRSIGTWFNAEKLPKTADLVARTWQDARYYMWSLKDQYARARPYQLEPKIKNLQDTTWPAYPSGHASYAYMLAYLYSAISPAHTSVFMSDAYMIAHSREIIGVHFPSDSEAGRIFARKFIDLLLQNDVYAQELKAVQAEWEDAARAYP